MMEMFLTLQVCFDSSTILRTDLLRKRDQKATFLAIVKSICQRSGGCCRGRKRTFTRRSQSLSYRLSDESTRLLPTGRLAISVAGPNGSSGKSPILSVEKLSYGFETRRDDEEEGDITPSEDGESTAYRNLFENVGLDLYAGSKVLVCGPSGVGKSSLLRILAGLIHADGERVVLLGKSQNTYVNMPLYRKMCRYVPQTKVDIPGTPYDFMAKISSFKSWKSHVGGVAPTPDEIKSASKALIRSWGMNTSLLDSEWKILSGGESQRILVAISLASLPHGGVILLDESTSALDVESKLKVEKSVEEYCRTQSIAAVWISHDPGQQDRMKGRCNGV